MLIWISGLLGSKSLPASAFAIADGYQIDGSGAPLNPWKKLTGLADARMPPAPWAT